MQIKVLTPIQAISKAYQKQKPPRNEIEVFKKQVLELLKNLNPAKDEEFNKKFISAFLEKTFYQNHLINTSGKIDLAVYLGKDEKSNVGVISEVKAPAEKSQMITKDNLNAKAMYQVMLYYLRERIEEKNSDIKNILITNGYEWFIFDAKLFEKLFYKNTALVNDYKKWSSNEKVSKNTDLFYDEIAPAHFKDIEEIEFVYFDLRKYKKSAEAEEKSDEEKKLIPVFKIFSKPFLLREPFANDSNSLDKQFYGELLHIIGLEELKVGSKKVIQRKDDTHREPGSILENTIEKLKSIDALSNYEDAYKFGDTEEEKLFNIALQLNITWINRILFLKLLEAQLVNYHRGNEEYKFLDKSVIEEYDDLDELFHEVLARKIKERSKHVREKFKDIPYLNSSLFERSALEQNTLYISALKDRFDLSVLSNTILRDEKRNKLKGKLSTLTYLLRFLDAYDFSSESTGEEIQEEGKSLISASVLGLIFEKINGYKEGSFFTPGFITMYMSRETLRRAVVQKFNDELKTHYKDFDELKSEIDRTKEGRRKANEIINSLKVCDPAVGSGHFLVSVLNEILTIKSELGILNYKDGSRIQNYAVQIDNDELIVTDVETEGIFKYHLNEKGNIIPELQKLQETLFHEKQTIIENCLFGVDINPNSVNICRLRLWIELLKHSYYTNESGYKELETLPNIDINIKQGNSLISRFDLKDQVFTKGDRTTLELYKMNVKLYKNATDRTERKNLKDSIERIKDKLLGMYVDPLNEDRKQLRKLNQQLTDHQITLGDLSGKSEAIQARLEKRINKLTEKIVKQEEENELIYRDVFEWRFEFPEVLDEEGNFEGFDVVIGNPPYIRGDELGIIKHYLTTKYKVYNSVGDIYTYFYEKAIQISRISGNISFITSNKFIRSKYGSELRIFLSNYQIYSIVDFGELPVFEDASTFPMIFMFGNKKNILSGEKEISFSEIDNLKFDDLKTELSDKTFDVKHFSKNSSTWHLLQKQESYILEKMNKNSLTLEEYTNGQIKFGIKTGFNEAFIISEEQKNSFIQENAIYNEVIKPFINGNDVRKYQIDFANQYIILTKIGIDINKYPLILDYLKKYKDRLEKRSDKGNKWYELRPCSYYNIFEKPKIIYPDIALESRFTIDIKNYYPNATLFVIPLNDKYLLGLLNSKIVWYYLSKKCPVIGSEKKRGRLRLKTVYLSKLPIYKTPNLSKEKIANLVTQILTAKKENPEADTSALEKEIDQLVYKLYGLTEEEIKIVEESVG